MFSRSSRKQHSLRFDLAVRAPFCLDTTSREECQCVHKTQLCLLVGRNVHHDDDAVKCGQKRAYCLVSFKCMNGLINRYFTMPEIVRRDHYERTQGRDFEGLITDWLPAVPRARPSRTLYEQGPSRAASGLPPRVIVHAFVVSTWGPPSFSGALATKSCRYYCLCR